MGRMVFELGCLGWWVFGLGFRGWGVRQAVILDSSTPLRSAPLRMTEWGCCLRSGWWLSESGLLDLGDGAFIVCSNLTASLYLLSLSCVYRASDVWRGIHTKLTQSR